MTAKDPYRYFRVEARELVDGLSRGVLALEREPERRGAIVPELFRLAHTLKGAARVVRLPAIAELAHALEDELAIERDAEGALGRERAAALLARVDAISELVAAIEAPPSTPSPSNDEPRRAREGEVLIARVDGGAVDALLETLADLSARVDGMRDVGARLTAIARRDRGEDRALTTLAGELSEAIDGASGDLRRLGVEAHALHLVSAATVFAQLERAARDAAEQVGKSVVFEAKGGESRLDGRVLASLRDALLHVVRNAVDHGIERVEERLAAGKPPAGRITLAVEILGHRARIVCRDDGRGVDVAAVGREAARRGLVAGDAPTTADQAVSLIFQPGVSTRAEASTVSGRGVGLDVVRDIVARLRGEVALQSEPGRGVTITLSVPVSLSSVSALLIEAGGVTAALPLDAVRRTRRIDAAEITRAPDGGDVIFDDGRAIPFFTLERWFLNGRSSSAPARFTAVVVEAEGALAAVGVDHLVGTAHVVMRPIPALAGELPFLGAGLSTGGAPQPVIDPSALVRSARSARAPAPAAAPEPPLILIIDDSLTTRMLEQSILESAGYRTDLASSAEEALARAASRHYDLFIVDVEMPGMNGFQFIARTKADPALRTIPAIVVSSRASDDDRRRGAEAGARGYVDKGQFTQGVFLDLVRELAR